MPGGGHPGIVGMTTRHPDRGDPITAGERQSIPAAVR